MVKTKKQLHDLVEDYCNNWCGEPVMAYYLHEQIDESNARDKYYQEFIEYVKEL